VETYSLDLHFIADRKRTTPHSPMADICIKNHTGDGLPLVTPRCVTIDQLEYQIDRLQEELEVIRRKARAYFLTEVKGVKSDLGATRSEHHEGTRPGDR